MDKEQLQKLLQAVGAYIAWTQGEGDEEDGEGRFNRMVAAYRNANENVPDVEYQPEAELVAFAEYVACSPPKENGGFSDAHVSAAKRALESYRKARQSQDSQDG